MVTSAKVKAEENFPRGKPKATNAGEPNSSQVERVKEKDLFSAKEPSAGKSTGKGDKKKTKKGNAKKKDKDASLFSVKSVNSLSYGNLTEVGIEEIVGGEMDNE